MARYGKKAQRKVKRAMRERKRGKLRSGSGKKVKSRKQAIAIALSETRREGGKAPKKKTAKKLLQRKLQRTAVGKEDPKRVLRKARGKQAHASALQKSNSLNP